ncbi:MAG: AtpZ/AtpI family protein [Terracidiphilus sp.]
MLVSTPMPFQNPAPENKTQGKTAGGFQSLVQAEKLMQIAFVLPSAMIIGWLAGAWADAKLHQSWIMIVGVIFGCISGLYYVIRLAMDAEKSAGKTASSVKTADKSGINK